MMYIWSGLQAKGAILKRKSATLVVLLTRKKKSEKRRTSLSPHYLLPIVCNLGFRLKKKKRKRKELVIFISSGCTHSTLGSLNAFSYYGRTVDPEFNYR